MKCQTWSFGWLEGCENEELRAKRAVKKLHKIINWVFVLCQGPRGRACYCVCVSFRKQTNLFSYVLNLMTGCRCKHKHRSRHDLAKASVCPTSPYSIVNFNVECLLKFNFLRSSPHIVGFLGECTNKQKSLNWNVNENFLLCSHPSCSIQFSTVRIPHRRSFYYRLVYFFVYALSFFFIAFHKI